VGLFLLGHDFVSLGMSPGGLPGLPLRAVAFSAGGDGGGNPPEGSIRQHLAS
jgi:hypothetical protein